MAGSNTNESLASVFVNDDDYVEGQITSARKVMYLDAIKIYSPYDSPVDDDEVLASARYERYMEHTSVTIGVTGGTKTRARSDKGFTRYFRTQYERFLKEGGPLISFGDWRTSHGAEAGAAAATADAPEAAPSAAAGVTYPVTLKESDIGPKLLAMLKDLVRPAGEALQLAIMDANPDAVGTIIQETLHYDMSDMLAIFPTLTMTDEDWFKLVLSISEGLVYSHKALRQLAEYMITAEDDTSVVRATKFKQCIAAAIAHFVRENIPRAVCTLQILLKSVLPAAGPPLETVTEISDAERLKLWRLLAWFDLNDLPTVSDDMVDVTGIVVLENMAICGADGVFRVTKGCMELLWRDTKTPLPVEALSPIRDQAIDSLATGIRASGLRRMQT